MIDEKFWIGVQERFEAYLLKKYGQEKLDAFKEQTAIQIKEFNA